jgi:hypothetical protein
LGIWLGAALFPLFYETAAILVNPEAIITSTTVFFVS